MIRRLMRHALWILAAGLAGCASLPEASSGDMCSQIAEFANSSASDHSVHWVELTADRKCASDSYAPGEHLCQFLTMSTSPDIGRERALECLHDTVVERYTEGQATTVRYTARLVEHTDRMVIVRVEYPADTQVKSSLRISAQRVPQRWVNAR